MTGLKLVLLAAWAVPLMLTPTIACAERKADDAPHTVEELVVVPEQAPEWITCKGVMHGRYNKDIMTDCSTSRGVSKSGKNFYVFTLKDDDSGYRSRIYFWGSPLTNGRSSIIAVSTEERAPAAAEGECLVSDDEESMACSAVDRRGTSVSIKTEKW